MMEAVREMRRRVLRSARKRFHVRDSGPAEVVLLLLGCDGVAEEAVVELVRWGVLERERTGR